MKLKSIICGVLIALIIPDLASANVVDCAHCGAKNAREVRQPEGCDVLTVCGQHLGRGKSCDVERGKMYFQCIRQMC
jgi:hypothetical protein